jgi:GntR family transcriptional regulator / MocR family aminotransferase
MELTLSLDHDAAMPLHRQVYAELRRSILTGRLLPGQRVPSTRSLSQSLGISRTTVTQGYEQLLSEGYLETRHGSGTFVCGQLPETLLQTEAIAPIDPPKPSAIRLSRYAQSMTGNPLVLQTYPDAEISFRYGRPALQHFPIDLWRKLLSRHCNADTGWLDYALDAQGDVGLRTAIAGYLRRARAVQCDPSQIVLTNGTQQGLDLILRVLIEPGDTIALEDPGYLSARKVFLSHQVNLLPIPVDASGLVVEYLTQLTRAGMPPVRLLSVTPSHQFPTGATLSLSRRLALLQWSRKTGAIIIEDDYDSEYRYGDQPMPALQGLDSSDSVIYMGTFSKVLFPSLRIGYLVLPPQLVPFIAQAKWLSDRQLPMLEQKVLTDFIEAGHLESHIRKMRSHYDRRRQVLVQALQQHFDSQVTILGEKAGIHVMVRFSLDLSGAEIMARSLQAGVGIVPALPCYLADGGDREFILGYGELEEGAIVEGIQRLAIALLGSMSFFDASLADNSSGS